MIVEKTSKPARRELFAAPWPTIWVWIFLAIIILGIAIPNNPVLTIIKLGGIILCFVYSLTTFPRDKYLHFALLLTCIADLILAFNNTSEAGIMLFLCVQVAHLARLDGAGFQYQILSFSVLLPIVIICNQIWQLAPMIYVICGFYLVALGANIYVSWRWIQRDPGNLLAKLALIGFILFFCCDICTGVSYLALNNIFPSFVYAPANFLAWFFYYPSQILVSNSSKCVKISPKGR